MDLYLENTISKPPTLNFYGISKNYKIYGFVPLIAVTGPNSISVLKKGRFIVEFNDLINNENSKDIYSLIIPSVITTGITMGKRIYNYSNLMIVQSETQKLSVVVKFNPDKRGAFASMIGLSQKTFPDYVKGFIVDSKHIIINQHSQEHKCTAKEKDYICQIDGEWTHHFSFDKNRYWSKEEHNLPYRQKLSSLLPSDSSLRKDIIAFKENNEDEAQKIKEEYEQMQRNDRELRKKTKLK